VASVFAERAGATFPGTNGRIVFTGYHSGDGYELYTVAPDGSDLKQLTVNTAVDDQAVFSPDGSKIAFFSDRGDVGSNLEGRRSGNYEIYVMDAGGGNLVQLTKNTSWDWQPDWY
jgi:Tol biopolymer transport system component